MAKFQKFGGKSVEMEVEQTVLSEITNNCMETDTNDIKSRTVAYIYNDQYMKLCNELPKVENRVSSS